MPRRAVILCAVMLVLLSAAPQCAGCPSGSGGCRNCIARQLKSGCPGCVTMMQCMARCLWGGASRTKCVKECDCGGGYPRLPDCKKCLAQCRCSCSPAAA